MSNWNKTFYLSVTVLIAVLFTGCGQGNTVAQSPTPAATTATSTNTTTAAVPVTTSTTTASTGTLPPISYSYKLTGPSATYTTPKFNTDNILSVTITAGSP